MHKGSFLFVTQADMLLIALTHTMLASIGSGGCRRKNRLDGCSRNL